MGVTGRLYRVDGLLYDCSVGVTGRLYRVDGLYDCSVGVTGGLYRVDDLLYDCSVGVTGRLYRVDGLLYYCSVCVTGRLYRVDDLLYGVCYRQTVQGGWPAVMCVLQADCTGWMACYTLWMMQIAVVLGHSDLVYCDLITRFLSHFLRIATAMNRSIHQQGWVTAMMTRMIMNSFDAFE